MSACVLLNLLNDLRKSDKMLDLIVQKHECYILFIT